MLIRHELRYDASPDAVFEMLADPAFRARVCEAQDVVSHDIDLQRNGDGFTLSLDQVQRSEGLPPIAQKFTGDTTRAIQVEDWPDASGGTVRVEAPGKPSKISGTVSLAEDGGGTVETVELDVKITVPLIGGKLEKLLVERIVEGLEIEQTVGREWLA